MINFFKTLFGGKKPKPRFSEEKWNQHYEAKKAALEKILGPMHHMVGHAIIPFQGGGAVDMYCFPNSLPGTAFATMELIKPDGGGPKPNGFGTYELVSFTKQTIPASADKSYENHPFDKIERHMCGIMTTVGFYSFETVLNPGETFEVPAKEGGANTCLVFDHYDPDGIGFIIDGKRHYLLLCLEVFRSEMEYAIQKGSAPLLEKLKHAGHYPYSDLDREPVV